MPADDDYSHRVLWAEVLALVRGEGDWRGARPLIVHLVLAGACGRAFRFSRLCNNFPSLLLRLVKEPFHADSTLRRHIATKLRSSCPQCLRPLDAGFTCTRRSRLRQEFVHMRDTGTCDFALSRAVLGFGACLPGNAQAVKGMSSELQCIAKRPPATQHPLASVRRQHKCPEGSTRRMCTRSRCCARALGVGSTSSPCSGQSHARACRTHRPRHRALSGAATTKLTAYSGAAQALPHNSAPPSPRTWSGLPTSSPLTPFMTPLKATPLPFLARGAILQRSGRVSVGRWFPTALPCLH